MLKRTIASLLIVFLLIGCKPAAKPTSTPLPLPPTLAPAQVGNPLFSGTETTPSRVNHKGVWILLIYYRNKGTRSEGQHGVLLKDGQVITSGSPGAMLETELGTMKYYMHPKDMLQAWDTTGWNFANSGMIKPWEGPAK